LHTGEIVTQNLQSSFDEVDNDGGHVNDPQPKDLSGNNDQEDYYRRYNNNEHVTFVSN